MNNLVKKPAKGYNPRFLRLSKNNAYVGLSDVEYEDGKPSIGFHFRNTEGVKTEFSLSLEAFEALKQLILDPDSGEKTFKYLNVGEVQIVYKIVDGKEVEAARLATERKTTDTE